MEVANNKFIQRTRIEERFYACVSFENDRSPAEGFVEEAAKQHILKTVLAER